ncbi:hypothetical protein [Alkaliphilus sp. B6464]|uniref:hypothetical protein n=1 Tax=Alkaliphilus sp. B6464 TaxID=2731219 RepID=UPI001BA827FA|nr:hypothetical protein [Alkaliphilus sp. B6464]QUH22206.1 hypothetical protein HYG84_20070 [Alkaliphilus sp. B6464]
MLKKDTVEFKFSEHGIKNENLFIELYSDFIEWCKSKVPSGIFSTYVDEEPICFSSGGIELSYRTYLKNR